MSLFKRDDPIEEMLERLQTYGSPMLWRMDSGGWVAKMDVHLAVAGAKCEITSDYKHKKPSDAVAQLLERTLKTLNTIGT